MFSDDEYREIAIALIARKEVLEERLDCAKKVEDLRFVKIIEVQLKEVNTAFKKMVERGKGMNF